MRKPTVVSILIYLVIWSTIVVNKIPTIGQSYTKQFKEGVSKQIP